VCFKFVLYGVGLAIYMQALPNPQKKIFACFSKVTAGRDGNTLYLRNIMTTFQLERSCFLTGEIYTYYIKEYKKLSSQPDILPNQDQPKEIEVAAYTQKKPAAEWQ